MISITSGLKLSSGSVMPMIGLGTWQTDNEGATIQAIEAAIDAGYRHIDTAYVYENEAFIGKALKNIFDSKKLHRSDLFIVTKLPEIGMKMEDVEYFCKKSLSSLQLDYIDLYLIHSSTPAKRPKNDALPYNKDGVFNADLTVDITGTWKGMEALVKKGLVRAIGLSNFNSKQIQRIVDIAHIKPDILQVECHAYLPQYELQTFCKNLNIHLTAYAPIGSPALQSFIEKKFNTKFETPFPKLLEEPVVKSLAQKYKKTPAQVLLRNLLQRDIIIIPKSSNPQRIKENIDLFDFELTNEDMDNIKSVANGFRYFKFDTSGCYRPVD